MIRNSSAGCPQPRTDNEQSPYKIFNRLFVRGYAQLGTACATISRLGTACATISRLGTATIPKPKKLIISFVLNRTFGEYMRLIGKQQYTKV